MKNKILFFLTAITFFSSCNNLSPNNNSLVFNKDKFTIEKINYNGKDIVFRKYTGIPYVKYPVDKEHQVLNIYVPIEYYENKKIGDFDKDTAPIFFPNSVGGYMPSLPIEPKLTGEISGEISRMGRNESALKNTPNATLFALIKGYVVVAPATRGRTSPLGKAPAGLVDLKSAIKYLHFNDKNIPGDSNKIISNGTSAGGAFSLLLGASVGTSELDKYYKILGSAPGSDEIFAVSSYCPITNLENADIAYEWQFSKLSEYLKMNFINENGRIKRNLEKKKFNSTEKELSKTLKSEFPDYINSLNLKNDGTTLTLEKDGNGSFKNYIKNLIISSFEKSGEDIKNYSFFILSDGKIIDIDFDKYIEFMGRSKGVPAFDDLNLETPENQLFGNIEVDKKHFSNFNKKYFSSNEKADEKIISLLNPLYYIENRELTVKNWRIRHDSIDSDTSFPISAIINLKLKEKNCDVDYQLTWNKKHSGDYDLNELFDWFDKILNSNYNSQKN